MIFCKLLPVYQFVSPTTHAIFINCQPIFLIKAYELSTLTGTQVLLLVVSETGLVYTFTTPKLQPLVTKPEGKNLIQACLNAPDVPTSASDSTSAISPTVSFSFLPSLALLSVGRLM